MTPLEDVEGENKKECTWHTRIKATHSGNSQEMRVVDWLSKLEDKASLVC